LKEEELKENQVPAYEKADGNGTTSNQDKDEK
jgi:hypothetical protein